MGEQSMVRRGLLGVAVIGAALACLWTAPAAAQVPIARADVNADCTVTMADVTLVRAALGRRCGQAGFNPAADTNGDCRINNTDVTFVTRNINKPVCEAPPVPAPTIAATVTPAANSQGWHNRAVTVSFSCTNAVSCPAPVVVSSEGAGQVLSRTVANTAGVTATTQVTLNVDMTAPVVTVALPPSALPGDDVPVEVSAAADLSGLYRTTLFVRRNAEDTRLTAPFGLAWTIPADAPAGLEEPVEIVAEDRAGNFGSIRRVVLVDDPDLTDPLVGVSAPASAAPGSAIPVRVDATDDRALARVLLVSTVDATTTPVQERTDGPFSFQAVATIPGDVPEGSIVTFSVTGTDASGNTASASAQVRVVTLVETTSLEVQVDPVFSPTFQAGAVLTGTINRGQGAAPPPPVPIVASVAPLTGRQGETVQLTVAGIGTAFTNLTQVALGPGISVLDVVADDPTTLRVRVAVAPDAGVGPRVVSVSTGQQEALLASAFSVLPGRGLVTGTLVDADGQPIANAQVCVPNSAVCVTSGADGTFTFADVEVDTRRVVVTAPGYEG
ncbi:MAG: hypothetical protein HOP14_09130, partial [Acidobacteria bacterium]|nr:hypothetical protein [Acidobacteriota bacterium]